MDEVARKRIAKLDAALTKALKRIELLEKQQDAMERERLRQFAGYPGYD